MLQREHARREIGLQRRSAKLPPQDIHVGKHTAGLNSVDLIHRFFEDVIDELIPRKTAVFQQFLQSIVRGVGDAAGRVGGHRRTLTKKLLEIFKKILTSLTDYIQIAYTQPPDMSTAEEPTTESKKTKQVTISADLHAALKTYCKDRGLVLQTTCERKLREILPAEPTTEVAA